MLYHETALRLFLWVISEYAQPSAGKSLFSGGYQFGHFTYNQKLRLCMCTIHGGRGPADKLKRGFDDSMVGGVCRFILAVTPRLDT